MKNNHFILETEAISENESFLRNVVANFALQLSPTLEEISDIKTAVSEAVTNCVVHAYLNKGGKMVVSCKIEDLILTCTVQDFGCGIEDIDQATKPFFTTKEDDERAGLGFTVMTALMNEMTVENTENGVIVTMTKSFPPRESENENHLSEKDDEISEDELEEIFTECLFISENE